MGYNLANYSFDNNKEIQDGRQKFRTNTNIVFFHSIIVVMC